MKDITKFVFVLILESFCLNANRTNRGERRGGVRSFAHKMEENTFTPRDRNIGFQRPVGIAFPYQQTTRLSNKMIPPPAVLLLSGTAILQ